MRRLNLSRVNKRILKWPKHYSNTTAVIIIGFILMQCRILERKLGFLQSVLDLDSRSVSGRVVEALSHDGISSTCLVNGCMKLEESCGVTITKGMLGGKRLWNMCQKEEL